MTKQWLSRHAFWHIHLPAPNRIDRPHYQVTTPNEMHQFDLLYMPSDTLYRNKYKYILAGIDAASRYKVMRPLRTKQVRDMAKMIEKVSPRCVKHLYGLVDELNDTETEMIGMKSKDAIKLKKVPLVT